MKNLIISLSLISSLLIGQSALAKEEVKPLVETIETVVVVAKPETSNFEIYSIEITKNVLNSTMKSIRDDISASIMNNASSLTPNGRVRLAAPFSYNDYEGYFLAGRLLTPSRSSHNLPTSLS